MGVILDARDIPLHLPRRSDDRRAVIARWRSVLLREPIGERGEAEAGR